MDQQTKRDLINIMKISAKKDIKNKDVLSKLIKISKMTDNFSSPIGKVFINRVKQLLSGQTQEFECIICKKNKASNGIVCKKCTDLYNEKTNKVHVEKNADEVKNNQHISKTKTYNSRQNEKKKYNESLFGTFMYEMTASIRNKEMKRKLKENETYQEPVSGHVFIGMFTVLFSLIYLFSLYAGAVVLFVGLGMALYAFIKKVAQYKKASLGVVLISIIFWPIGLIFLILGIIKKIGYIYENRKYIGLGFLFYGYVGVICGAMCDVPGNHSEPGIVGYLNMIFYNAYGARWNRTQSSVITEMIIFLIGGAIIVFFMIGWMSLYLDEVEEYCCNRGLTAKQAFVKSLQGPVEILLMFAPLVLYILCKIESLEDGWALDIDNETHEVSAYDKVVNGKRVQVRGYTRKNPDDIINNNLSYRGNNPYNGSNPIRNNRHK